MVALAKHFDLTNATFWRHFPDIASDVAERRRQRGLPSQATDPAGHEQPHIKLAQLSSKNHELVAQLDVAIAQIQRLTIENDRLRREREAARGVTRIPDRRRAGLITAPSGDSGQ